MTKVDKVVTKRDNKLHKLKYWRGVVGLKQDDLAVLLGYKASNYSQKENGNIEVFLSEMIIIQKAINKRLAKKGMPALTLDDIFLP